MRNMITSSTNKNRLMNFERNHLKYQKPKKLLGPKMPLKCMKNEIKQKRKGRMVLPVLDDKNLEKNWRENDKKLIVNLDRSKRE